MFDMDMAARRNVGLHALSANPNTSNLTTSHGNTPNKGYG